MSKIRSLVSSVNQFDRESLVEQFLCSCEVQGLGKDSLRSHRYALSQFFELYKGALSDVAPVKKALTQMLQGKQDAYYNKQLNAVRKFLDYCVPNARCRICSISRKLQRRIICTCY